LFFKVKKRSFVLVHCWLKLNGTRRCQLPIANSIKTAHIDTKEEAGDSTDPIKELTKKIRRRFRRKKVEGGGGGGGEARRGSGQNDRVVREHLGEEGAMCQAL
jgi:hypothetical protein